MGAVGSEMSQNWMPPRPSVSASPSWSTTAQRPSSCEKPIAWVSRMFGECPEPTTVGSQGSSNSQNVSPPAPYSGAQGMSR